MLHAGLYFLNASATTLIVPAEANMPFLNQLESWMIRHVIIKNGSALNQEQRDEFTSFDYINTNILGAGVDTFLHKF